MSKDLETQVARIENNIANHFAEKTTAQFLKDKLGAVDSKGSSDANKIIEHAVHKAKLEEKPEWTKFLFDLMKSDESSQPSNQTNLYIGSELTDNNLNKIINVNPLAENKGINKII